MCIAVDKASGLFIVRRPGDSLARDYHTYRAERALADARGAFPAADGAGTSSGLKRTTMLKAIRSGSVRAHLLEHP